MPKSENECSECNKDFYHEDHEGRKLCEGCMFGQGLNWDREEREFVQDFETCDDCGGEMSWCSLCCVHSRHCCVDYGTCMCS